MFLLALILPITYIMSQLPFGMSVVVAAGLIGLPVVAFCFADLAFAMGLVLFWAVMVVFAGKYTTAPIGTLLDLLILIGAVGLLLRQIKERNWEFLRNPLSTQNIPKPNWARVTP